MSIWFRPVTAADASGRFPNTMMAHVGMQITEIGDDFVRGTMPVDHRTHQPYGLLHGGASVALAETLGSFGCMLTLDDAKYICMGQEINANHIRGVKSGVVTGTAKPFYMGGTSQVWGIEIKDEAGKLVCVSRLTMAVRPKPTA
jgi:1,4-dihydroxy-2-naphthoyl-CoA hydrolase